MCSTIQTMKCYNPKNGLREALQTFQKGILFSIKSLKALFDDLMTKMDISYTLTHRLNQDCLENFFSQVRGSERFKEHPNSVECLYNIRAIILGRNPTVTKQLHSNTIDKLPDEYVTSAFCKHASKTISASTLDESSNSSIDNPDALNENSAEYDNDIENLELFEECSSMSSNDGIGNV